MSKRDILKQIAHTNIGKRLDLDWFKGKYPEFLYKPDVLNATEEININLIEGLLWDYKISKHMIEAGDGTYRKKAQYIIIKNLTRKDKKDKFYLFMSVANVDDEGCAIVTKKQFEQVGLPLGNGGSWCRDNSKLATIFHIERHKDGNGNKITSVELKKWNTEIPFSQRIRKDIVDTLQPQNCVIMGSNGHSENTTIEIDHKDGRKDDARFNNIQKQQIEDFQPLCKAANDFKRQKCKECKESNKRWKATNLEGNRVDFYKGEEEYTNELGCVGCYLYDPVAYRKYVTSPLLKIYIFFKKILKCQK